MSHADTGGDESTVALDRGLVAGGVVAFLGLLAAYCVLAALGKDAEGVVRLTVTLAGIFGLGVYNRAQHKSQVRRLDRITSQTNGVLDDRIEAGTIRAIRSVLTDDQLAALAALPKARPGS